MVNQRTSCFLCLKYFIIAFTLIQLIGTIFICFQLDDYCKNIKFDFIEPENENAVRNSVITTLFIVDIFTIIGLFGAIKENYCLSMTYGIFMTVDAITTIGLSFRVPSYTFASVLTIIIVIISYTFAHQIRCYQLSRTDDSAFGPQQVIIDSPKDLSAHNAKFANMPAPPPPYSQFK